MLRSLPAYLCHSPFPSQPGQSAGRSRSWQAGGVSPGLEKSTESGPRGRIAADANNAANCALGFKAMSKLDYRNIEQSPSRCGGQPVVVGTRVRVAAVLMCYRLGMRVEEIVQQYPGLKPADVHDALAYAYDHLEEIEADLAADDEATVKAQHSAGKSGP